MNFIDKYGAPGTPREVLRSRRMFADKHIQTYTTQVFEEHGEYEALRQWQCLFELNRTVDRPCYTGVP